MRIQKISVKKYKNLVDFKCEFSDSNISAFIGNNGSGKSNLLEVITEVFSYAKKKCEDKLYNIIVPPEIYGCEIEYEKDGIFYTLKYNHPNVSLHCADKSLSNRDMNAALPNNILIYYAGETMRQARTAAETFDERYNYLLKNADNKTFPGYKYIDYYSVDDLGLLLLTSAVYKGDYYEKLLALLKCKEILPKINIMLQNPKGKKQENADTYWGAKGFVQSFLDALRRYVSKTENLLAYYSMHFNEIAPFAKTSKNESEFFAKLKALKNAKYLHWIMLELCRDNGEKFTFDMLSEGEKQLALLYLLTSFTAEDNCLYIFDEFDAYLHLNWQKSFAKLINEARINGHIIFTTHSPATIAGLHRKNVYVMSMGKASLAPSETYNRSLDEIMEEHMLVSMRPLEYSVLVQEFRNAVMHNHKDLALSKLEQIQEFIGDEDPFLITARIALNRMEEP
ncbi:MAG: AAA family ATPase [Eubacterium sp.]